MSGLQVEASAYTVPTDAPEADGTLSWTSTTMVLVEVAAEGSTGFGWTYGPAAAVSMVKGLLSSAVSDVSPIDVPAAHEAMCRALRNAGRVGLGAMALSAVDCALWDLKARILETPLHRLLGRARQSVDVYGSGGFTTYDDAQMTSQLVHWTGEQRIPRVKIKIGESWGAREERDLERLRRARSAVGDSVELFADANGGYSVKQAIRVGRAADDLGLRWFEEPVSSDDLAGLRAVADAVGAEVTAGEYGWDLPYFARMLPSVDCLQVDVTRCGGITEFVRAAALARASGRDVSAHCAPGQHAPVMSALPNARHIEWFHDHVRIERMFFDGTLDPVGGSVTCHDDAPGNGLTLRRLDMAEFQVA